MVAKKVVHKLPKETEKFLKELGKLIPKIKFKKMRKFIKEGVSIRMASRLVGIRNFLNNSKKNN